MYKQSDTVDTNMEGQNATKRAKKMYKVGVQHTPQQFFELAKTLTHPMTPEHSLPEVLKEAIHKNLTEPQVDLAKSRMRAILLIKSMAEDLEEQEEQLKRSMPEHVSKVLCNKRILLWEALLKASEYPDLEVVDLMKSGTALTGEHSVACNYPADWKPATATTQELLDSALWRRKSLQTTEDEHSDSLHKATLEEVKLGHLQGPYTEDQIHAMFGKDTWLFTKRFALEQGTPEHPKIRVIDDCRRSGLNSAYTVNFKLELLDLDILAAVLMAISKACSSQTVSLGATTEQRPTNRVHPTVLQDTWLGRTVDLSKAYKQMPLDEQSIRMCVLGYPKDGQWMYYTTTVLPFGASASVYSFNRVSRSIHYLLCSFLHVICTVFFDDFPMVSTRTAAGLTSKTVSYFLNLLGWDHAQLGSKAVDFSEEFTALGITVQLRDLHRGSFVYTNKEGRVPKIIGMLDRLAKQNSISRAEAAELQGHINFAAGFFLDRSIRFLFGRFDALAKTHKSGQQNAVRPLCELAKAILLKSRPRSFEAVAMDQPHLIFTDGAWENAQASAGMVFHNGVTQQTEVQEIHVPPELIEHWKAEVGEQLICQIEMYAYLVVRFGKATLLHNRAAIAWVDNEAARMAIGKASADSPTLTAMCRVLQELESQSPSLLWSERVASYSNPADKPSRKMVREAAAELRATPRDEPLMLPSAVINEIIRIFFEPMSLVKLT